MKKIIFILVIGLFTMNLVAKAETAAKDSVNVKSKYCIEIKDGKLKVMHDGKEIMTDVTLSNGTVITKDANVVKKDGSRQALTNGECIDHDGNIMLPDEKDKMKKEK